MKPTKGIRGTIILWRSVSIYSFSLILENECSHHDEFGAAHKTLYFVRNKFEFGFVSPNNDSFKLKINK